MKIQYKLGLLAVGALMMSSCEKHDIIASTGELGQEVPAANWAPSSTVCKAGESFGFLGKYTTNTAAGLNPDRSEVWYQIVSSEAISISCKLGGVAYSLPVSKTDTVRSYQSMAVFPHSMATWENMREWHISGSVPVSRTLSPVKWADIEVWDQANFDAYCKSIQGNVDPEETLEKQFLGTVIGYLTNESTADSYYNNLRSIYLNYDFTNEQFAEVGLPEVAEGQDKSDIWKTDATKVVGYYRNVIVGEATQMEYLTAEQYEALSDDDKKGVYPYYKAAEWLFCRYDDNAGAVLTSVKPEWLPKFRALLEKISFPEWIYDTANSCYKVDFSRNYSLNAQFRVYDNRGNEGRAYDIYTISIN